MMGFAQQVMQAQQELQDAIRAGSRPSAFSQGVTPSAQPPQMPPQMPMMSPQMPMMSPQMPMMPPQMPMMPPQMPPQQFAKGGLAVWDKAPPKGRKSKPLAAKAKAKAKRRAKAAGRPYPNLVDNLAVRR